MQVLWPNCLNVRDLGGLPTRDGGVIRDGALIRSDSHFKLTDDGVAAVRACGVSRIIDLRRDVECDVEPSPFAGTPLYRNISVEEPADLVEVDHRSLAEIYQWLLDRGRPQFASVLASIADAPPGGVVVHCAGGKDRTGLVVAMALTIANVEPEVVAADYAVTEQHLRQANIEFRATITDEHEREWIRSLQATPPATMLTTLEHLDNRYGGVQEYLAGGGFTKAAQAALHHRLRLVN